MNKGAKRELAQMFSLMERMDKHLTLNEAEFEKMLMEDDSVGRVDFQSLDELVNTMDIGRSFVGLGYIQGYSNSNNDGPVKIYPTKDNFDTDFRQKVDSVDPNSRVYGKLNNMINDPEYSNPTGRMYAGNRSMASTHFQGVVKITNYVFNWGDAESLSNFYEKNRNNVARIRKNHGFGESDDFYDNDDWRRRTNKSGKSVYGGLGANPSYDTRKNPDGSDVVGPFHMKLNPLVSIYGDNDTYGKATFRTRPDGSQYQRRALRFGLGNINNQWEHFCLVDNNGEVDEVENSLAAIFHKRSVPQDLRKLIDAQTQQDEVNFINDLQNEINRQSEAEKTWLEDNIAYIVGKGVDRYTGERKLFRWVNKNIVIDRINVDPQELQPVIDAEVQRAYKEVKTH